jgi:uridine kinase
MSTERPAVQPVRRAGVLAAVAAHLLARDPGHPLRVGIDGVCGAGKSTFARDLLRVLADAGRPAVWIDSDGFHHVRERRYRQGRDSARGYYQDGYDFPALVERVLVPLGPGGSGEYAVRVHDLATDAVVTGDTARAAPDAVVLVDATFLQRGDLRAHWDEVIYLDVDPAVATSRGVERDAAALGGPAAARRAYESRYMAAGRIYLAQERPRERASIVIRHDDPAAPAIIRIGSLEA